MQGVARIPSAVFAGVSCFSVARVSNPLCSFFFKTAQCYTGSRQPSAARTYSTADVSSEGRDRTPGNEKKRMRSATTKLFRISPKNEISRSVPQERRKSSQYVVSSTPCTANYYRIDDINAKAGCVLLYTSTQISVTTETLYQVFFLMFRAKTRRTSSRSHFQACVVFAC